MRKCENEQKLIFKDIDFDTFIKSGMNTSMDCAEYCGTVYFGELAFELLKSMEDDHLLQVSVMLTNEEVDEETFGEDILFVDTTNDVNAVAIIDTIVLEVENLEDKIALEELLKKEILNFIENFNEYDISTKAAATTNCFYC